MKLLAELLSGMPGAALTGDPGTRIRGVQQDSRKVQPGDLFIAVAGSQQDGARFIPQALERGASAIVTRTPFACPVALAVVEDTRLAVAELAAAWYGNPSRRLRVVGVTGTDGKTTTSHLLHAIFTANGDRTGLISTIQLIGGSSEANTTNLTTPDALTVQAALADMVAQDARRAVLETSSHALDQRRVDAIDFRAGVCTNIDREHLNYHGTLAAYVAAKGRLFELVAASGAGTIIRNAGDAASAGLPHPAGVRDWAFGFGEADVRGTHIKSTSEGTRFRLETPVGATPIETRLIGRFNVANWLAAAAVAVAEGVPLEAISEAARVTRPVAGRLETVAAGQPFRIVVDFAHTPQALAAALAALRPITPGRLIVVFGHAGERDPENRPRMGAAAAEGADRIIVTMDDPYSEDPNEIAGAVEAGILAHPRRTPFQREIDRRAAMRLAFQEARPGDTVLVAGRGHETIIEWGSRRIEFHDATVSRELAAELGHTPLYTPAP